MPNRGNTQRISTMYAAKNPMNQSQSLIVSFLPRLFCLSSENDMNGLSAKGRISLKLFG